MKYKLESTIKLYSLFYALLDLESSLFLFYKESCEFFVFNSQRFSESMIGNRKGEERIFVFQRHVFKEVKQELIESISEKKNKFVPGF